MFLVALLVLALFTLAHGQTRTWTMIKVTADAECKVLGTRNPPEVLYENGICYNEYVPPYELSYKYSKNSLVTFGGYDCGTVSGSYVLSDGLCMGDFNFQVVSTTIEANSLNLTSDVVVATDNVIAETCSLPSPRYELRNYETCYREPGEDSILYTYANVNGSPFVVVKVFNNNVDLDCVGQYSVFWLEQNKCFNFLDVVPVILADRTEVANYHLMLGFGSDDTARIPFMDQSLPPPSMKPEPAQEGEPKEFLYLKHYVPDETNKSACEDENSIEFEKIYEIGRCRSIPQSKTSQAFVRHHGGLQFMYWEGDHCNGTLQISLPVETEANQPEICSEILGTFGNVRMQYLGPQGLDLSQYDGALALTFGGSSGCSPKDENFVYALYPLDTCLKNITDDKEIYSTGGTSFIMSSLGRGKGVRRDFYDNPSCDGLPTNATVFGHKACVSESDGTGVMSFDPKTAARDILEYFAQGSPADYPLVQPPPSPPPPPPPPPPSVPEALDSRAALAGGPGLLLCLVAALVFM